MKKVLMSNGSAFSFDFGLKELVEHLQKEFKISKEHLIILGEEGEKITESNENNFEVFYCYHERDFALSKPDFEIQPIPRLTKLKSSESITVSSILDTMSILKTVLEKSYKYDHQLAEDLCEQATQIYIQLRNATEEIENKMICFQIAILNVSQFSNLDRLFSSISSLNSSLLQSLSDLPQRLFDMKGQEVDGRRSLYEAAFGEEEKVREFVEVGRTSAQKIEGLIREKRKEFEEIKEMAGGFMRTVEELLKPEFEGLVSLFNSINQCFISIKEIQSSTQDTFQEFQRKLPSYTLGDLVELQNHYTPRETDLVSLLSRINDLLSSFDSQRLSISSSLSTQYSHLSLLHSKASLISSQTPLYQAISDKQIKYLIQLKAMGLIPHTYRECTKEIQRRIGFKEGLKRELRKVEERVEEILREEGKERERFLSDHRDSLLFSLFPSFLDSLPSSFSFDLSHFDPLLPPLPPPDDFSFPSILPPSHHAHHHHHLQQLLTDKDHLLDQLQLSHDQLLSDNNQLKLSHDQLQLSHDHLKLSNDQLNHSIAEFKQINEELQNRIEGLAKDGREKEQMREEIKQMNERMKEMEKEWERAKREWERERKEKEEEMERRKGLMEEKDNLSISIHNIANEKLLLEHRISDLSSALSDLSLAKNELTSTKNELTSTQKELGNARDEVERMRNELEGVKNELRNARNEEGRMKSELANTNAAHSATLNDLSKLNTNLTSTVNDLDTTRHDLSTTKHQLSSTLNDLTNIRNDLTNTRNELSDVKSELEGARRGNEKMKEEIKRMEGEVRSIGEEKAKMTSLLGQKQKEISELITKIDFLNASLKSHEEQSSLSASLYQDSLSHTSSHKEKLEKELKEQSATAGNLRRENTFLIEEMAKKDNLLHSLKQTIQQMKEETTETKKELAGKLNALNDKVEHYKQRYEEIEKENLHLQVKLMNYEDDNDHHNPFPSPDPLQHPLFKEHEKKLNYYIEHEKKLSVFIEKFDKVMGPRRGNENIFQMVEETINWLAEYHKQSQQHVAQITNETAKLQTRLAEFDFPLSLKSSFGAPSPSPSSSVFSMIHSVMDWLDDFYLSSKLKKTIALTNFAVGDNVILFERKDLHLEIFSIKCPNYILSEDCEGIFTLGNNGGGNRMQSNRPQELMFATILSIDEKITTPLDDPYHMGPAVKYYIIFAEKFYPDP